MTKLIPFRRSSMLQPFEDLFEDIINDMGLFDSPAKVLEGVRHKAYPKINIYQKEGKLVIDASIPGLTKEDVKVHLENSMLTISGMQQRKQETNEDDYFYKEITQSAFSRSIQLPESIKVEDVEKLKASVKDGLLHIEIPYAGTAKKLREIPIEG